MTLDSQLYYTKTFPILNFETELISFEFLFLERMLPCGHFFFLICEMEVHSHVRFWFEDV